MVYLSPMGISQEIKIYPPVDFSKDFFKQEAESILAELASVDFRHITLAGAQDYSSIYAIARLFEAMQNLDIVQTDEVVDFWINEHDRWEKALETKENGDYIQMARELSRDCVRYLHSSRGSIEKVNKGFVLLGLSETIAPE